MNSKRKKKAGIIELKRCRGMERKVAPTTIASRKSPRQAITGRIGFEYKVDCEPVSAFTRTSALRIIMKASRIEAE